MKISRKKVTNLKAGDLVQGNVTSVKDLDATWYEVKSIKLEAKDTILVVQPCTFNGTINRKGSAFTESFNPRTVLAVMV